MHFIAFKQNIMKLIKIFISAFLLLVSIISLGQHNYINYYNKTNEAEYRLLCNNIALAKQTYADAFKMVKKTFWQRYIYDGKNICN